MQATDVSVDVDGMPETRPGLHVTAEGRLVGGTVEVEWEGPTDDRTAGVTEVDGVPVMMTSEETHKALRKDAGLPPSPPQHPNERSGGPGRGGQPPGAGAAAPAVTTSVDGAGNKRTTEHSMSVDMTVSGEDAAKLRRLLEGTAEEAMERAKRGAQR